MSDPKDPFAPSPDADVDLELGGGFEIEERHATRDRHADFIEKAKEFQGPRVSKSYAEKEHTTRVTYWTMTRVPVLLVLGWFTVSHLLLSSEWVFIDGVNLVFHEAGHYIFAWGGDTLHFLGGTLGQLMWPVGLALYFWFKQRQRFAAVTCTWWFGENLINIARYMHDAPVESLPLVGGDTHDWAYLYRKWDALDKAQDVADWIRNIGSVVMVATLAYLVYVTVKPTDDELAEGFRAD